ncbi:carbonic anhydrase [Chthonobacter albigriseus]|uniref:carbonic anhydrase n=1 Tax=Chthonobacter albigriseus TaxID=1683161 RepID=UPI0015EED61D|nr:carbonic anhydrase [Chthonobacter albigriseus]
MTADTSAPDLRPPLPDTFPDRLTSGYQAFRAGRYPTEEERYRRLGDRGQKPEIMMIGCCDSRVSPEVIFDAGPGEIFVVRNVANLVPPYNPDGELHGTSAALEFGVVALKVKHIVVMGHGRCGGVRAALDEMDPLTPGDFIGRWMSMLAEPAETIRCNHAIPEGLRYRALELEGVRKSIRNLLTFPCVQIRHAKGSLRLHGAWFDVSEGELHVLDPATGEFSVLKDGDQLIG